MGFERLGYDWEGKHSCTIQSIRKIIVRVVKRDVHRLILVDKQTFNA